MNREKNTSNQKTVRSAHLLSWQNNFCKIFEKTGKGDTIVVCSQRQVGKSFCLSQILLYTALNYKRSVSIYISPTNDSSRKFFNDLKGMIESSPLVKKLNESLLEIVFINNSKIILRSAESKLRGYSCKNGGILCVDEAQYVPADIWPIVLPFTNVDNSKKVIISTPRFKNGMFWDFYSRAYAGEEGYYLVSTKDYDTSMFLSEKQKNEYKKILSPQAYKSEILGEWLDNSECLFGNYHECFFEPEDLTPVYGGLDWSNNGGDNTPLVLFNAKRQMVGIEIVTNIQDPVDRAQRLADIINSYPTLKKVVAEKNSLGEVYISILKRKMNNPNILESFVTTNDSKKRIIEQLIVALTQKTITILPHPQLDLELGMYEMQELKRGNYTYNGKKDDCIMATAFAIEGFSSNSGTYSIGHSSMRTTSSWERQQARKNRNISKYR